MKKKIAIFALAALCAGSFTSCVDLDSDRYFEDRMTLERVFNNKIQSEEWLAYAYSFLLGPNRDAGSKTNEFFTTFDDCMYFGDRDPKFDPGRDVKETYNGFRMGQYDENWNNNAWDACWKGIYQASVFIDNIDKNTDMTEKERIDYKGQARFVRAYFYWLLLRHYGPVPIQPEHGIDYTQPYEKLYIARNTYQEVVDYIDKEMVQAAKEIQYTKRDAENIGRPTKGACLAARATALIYAASPLANGQLKNGQHDPRVTDEIAKEFKNFDGTPLLSTDYDESKWARAAAACKDVMELGVYELYHYRKVNTSSAGSPKTIVPPADGNFSEKNWPDGWANIDPQKSYAYEFDGHVSAVENPELIFTRGSNIADNDGMDALVLHEMPASASGWNTHGMTQKMVDAYYMNDGTDVPGKDSELNGGDGHERATGWTVNDTDYPPLKANVSLQYANREPRFYASCAYSGSIWERLGDPSSENRNKTLTTPVFYYRGGSDGYTNSISHLRTGIGVKKWYNSKDYIADRNNAYATLGLRDRVEPAMRYADILLMYAEALNELDGSYQEKSWDGSTTYTISRDINEIKKGIQPIRIRGGVPDYDEATYSDKNLLRAKIKRERMIELFGEGKRYYDLRRWMDAPIEESQKIYGLNVFMTAARRDEFMKVVPCSDLQQTFTTKMYFWPVTKHELKRNLKLVQAPGWKYYD